MGEQETFEVTIDESKPWTMRLALFEALTSRTKAEIAAEWKRLGMQLPTTAEINALPPDQQRELMHVAQLWLTWAGHPPPGDRKPRRSLELERDGNGRLKAAKEYLHE
jgi:hypothetical protein